MSFNQTCLVNGNSSYNYKLPKVSSERNMPFIEALKFWIVRIPCLFLVSGSNLNCQFELKDSHSCFKEEPVYRLFHYFHTFCYWLKKVCLKYKIRTVILFQPRQQINNKFKTSVKFHNETESQPKSRSNSFKTLVATFSVQRNETKSSLISINRQVVAK